MQKPQGYDQAPAYTGESQALPAGGYICKILKAEEVTSSGGRPMLAVLFDIEEGEHKGFYREQYDRVKQSNPDARWGGVFRQLTDGKSTPFFKGMITSIEVSNPPYNWEKSGWDEKTLAGKVFGGIFGREQYQNSAGEPRWSTKCQAIRSVETIRGGKFEVPVDKYLVGDTAPAGFTPIDNGDTDLPF